ncbi:MAG: recJ [Patescibacteria group bacterium]|nr:recJ [Patescibacteria group bacterium]
MKPDALLEKLLDLRGYKTAEDRENFLHPKYADMFDPFLMHDMSKSVARIFLAMEHNEKICVYSDYDADGIPGAVILHDFFKKAGYENFCNYIPHRHDEGYGVHKNALEILANDNVKLVITVDVGITAVDEVAFGNSLGLEIIITDHHEPLDVLPNAFAIVNPKLGDYPDRMLCGSGVAFKLVQAMIEDAAKSSQASLPAELVSLKQASAADGLRGFCSVLAAASDGWEKWLLDMAGLATLSDMVPLVNENRIIAYYGMKVLEKTKRPGLAALFSKSGINMNYLTETDIVFSITPKLNAASRMAHPVDAFNALATTDLSKATLAAEHLANLNDERKKIVAKIMKDVHKKVSARKLAGDLKQVLVVGDPSWPAGILGIIASKVVDEYSLTTFVWGSEGETIKGSVRGVGDISVVALMQSCAHLFVQFGGHEDAGGFAATRETIHFLEEEFCKKYDEFKHVVSKQVTTIAHDMELSVSDVTFQNYRSLRQMAPFGMGNPTPVFAFKNIIIDLVRQFGKTTEHLEVIIRDGNDSVKAICWYATADSFSEKIEQGKTMTLLGEFDFSVFRGKTELRLKIVDFIK